MKPIYLTLFFFSLIHFTFGQKKRYFFENTNKVSAYGENIDGKKNGEWIFYFPNGEIRAKGNYKMNEPEGIWLVARDQDYNFMDELHFDNGKQIFPSVAKAYYATGELRATWALVNGKPNGIYKEFYNSGQLAVTITYKDGNKDGIAMGYYPDGKIEKKASYKNNKLFGSFIIYAKNGKVKEQGTYNNLGKDGVYKSFYKNGQLKSTLPYKNGVKEGVGMQYYPDGKVQTKASFKNDTNNGYYTEYGKNGKIRVKGWYSRGKKSGAWKQYFEDGKLSSSTEYSGGKRNGAYVEYSIGKGDIYFKDKLGSYTEGRKSYTWYYYTPKREFRRIVVYKNGEEKIFTPIYMYVENKANKQVEIKLSYLKADNSSGWKELVLRPNEKYYVGHVMYGGIYYEYTLEGSTYYSKIRNDGPVDMKNRYMIPFTPYEAYSKYNKSYTLTINSKKQ